MERFCNIFRFCFQADHSWLGLFNDVRVCLCVLVSVSVCTYGGRGWQKGSLLLQICSSFLQSTKLRETIVFFLSWTVSNT